MLAFRNESVLIVLVSLFKIMDSNQQQEGPSQGASKHVAAGSRLPSRKEYRKTNAYSQRPSIQQILTVVLFAIHLVLHSVFVTRPIIQIGSPILFVSWALFYVLLVLMGVDYCVITCGDPVDRTIVDEAELAQFRYRNIQFRKNTPMEVQRRVANPYRTRYCEDCQHSVKFSSYHCWRCGRCVEGMDHHCKYLNNCIGARNYAPFFRMLVATTAYLLLTLMHGVWVFVATFSSPTVNQLAINRWAVLVLAIYSLVLILAVDSLLCFHFYISCVRNMTTVDYLFRDTPSNASSTLSQAKKDGNHDSAQNLHKDQDDNKDVQNSLKTPVPKLSGEIINE